MENTAFTRRVLAVLRVLTRVLSYGMTKTKTIKIPNTATCRKGFLMKTPRFSSAAVQQGLPAKRSLCLTKLHSFYLLTSLIFAKR